MRHFAGLAHTFARSHARTGSHACDVRLEFGVESEVDEGSRDLHPPPDNSHKYDRGLFEDRAAQSYIASCCRSRFHLWEYRKFDLFPGGLTLSVALGVFLPTSTLRGGWKAAVAGSGPCPGAWSPLPSRSTSEVAAVKYNIKRCFSSLMDGKRRAVKFGSLGQTQSNRWRPEGKFCRFQTLFFSSEQTRILPNINEHFKRSMMSKAAGSTSGCLDILNVKSSKCCASLLWFFAGSLSLQSHAS